MARPKKEKELSRSHLIAFRLTDIEYDLITSMAQEAGLSASAYTRKLLLEGNVNITYEVIADVPELQKLTAEFEKIGSNLNQIARYFHMGGIRSKECRTKSTNVSLRFLICGKKFQKWQVLIMAVLKCIVKTEPDLRLSF